MSDSEMFTRTEAALGRMFLVGGWRARPELSRLAESWRRCCMTWSPSHPATLGCLLALVREAWGGERILVSIYDGGTLVSVGASSFEVDGSSLGQSLVECLEASP